MESADVTVSEQWKCEQIGEYRHVKVVVRATLGRIVVMGRLRGYKLKANRKSVQPKQLSVTRNKNMAAAYKHIQK